MNENQQPTDSTKNRINIYIPPALQQRMDAVAALAAERGLGRIRWSNVAQAAFERECARRERAAAGGPSADDVDVEAIDERARRGRQDSYQVAYAAAIEAAGRMDEDDIYFLGDYDDSADGFEVQTGRPYLNEIGYPSNEYRAWADDCEDRRDDLIGPMIDAARRHAQEHGLRFHHDRAQAGAMAAFAEVCSRLQHYQMAQALADDRGADGEAGGWSSGP